MGEWKTRGTVCVPDGTFWTRHRARKSREGGVAEEVSKVFVPLRSLNMAKEYYAGAKENLTDLLRYRGNYSSVYIDGATYSGWPAPIDERIRCFGQCCSRMAGHALVQDRDALRQKLGTLGSAFVNYQMDPYDRGMPVGRLDVLLKEARTVLDEFGILVAAQTEKVSGWQR